MKTWNVNGVALTKEMIEEAVEQAQKKALYDMQIFGQGFMLTSYSDFTVEDWSEYPEELTEENIAKYPAAKKAHKLINSKLYKALK